MGPEAMAAAVLVLGSLHLDLVVEAPHLPARDETVMGSAATWRFGGKGGNQAVAAARMGARVAMAGRVGRDGAAATLIAALDAAGVDRAGVLASEGATGISVAIIETAGDYGAVVVSGVNRQVTGAEAALPAGPAVIVMQNEVPEAANRALADRRRPGDRLVLNAAPARAVAPALLAALDLLVVNRIEAAAMTGTPPGALDAVAAAERLRALGPRAVVVTLGAQGLVLAAPGARPLPMPAHPVPVVSTHGAGDAFTGALAAELARGAGLAAACHFAAAAAALTVASHPEARAGLTAAAARALADRGLPGQSR
jgi:ribokinase